MTTTTARILSSFFVFREFTCGWSIHIRNVRLARWYPRQRLEQQQHRRPACLTGKISQLLISRQKYHVNINSINVIMSRKKYHVIILGNHVVDCGASPSDLFFFADGNEHFVQSQHEKYKNTTKRQRAMEKQKCYGATAGPSENVGNKHTQQF